MPRSAAKAVPGPHQIAGADAQKRKVKETIARVVAEIRRESDAGKLPRRSITVNYVVKTRADICISTLKQGYHRESLKLVKELIGEVNGDAPAKPKKHRKPRRLKVKLRDQLESMAREVEAARYTKLIAVAEADERAAAARKALEAAEEDNNALRLERDRLRRDLEGLRSVSSGRRSGGRALAHHTSRVAFKPTIRPSASID